MIRVKSIQINRFRGIREGAVREFADVNLLVGRNNSGKSTIVEAVHRLAYSVASGEAADPLNRKVEVWIGARGENGFFPPELWYILDQTEPIYLGAEVGKSELKESESITFTIAAQGGNARANGSFDFQGRAGLRRDDVVQFLSRASVFRPEDARNSAVERTLWQKIIGSRHDKALTQALNTIFAQNADSYSLLPDGKLWVLFPKYSVPLDSQGEGNRAALRCLTLLTVLRRTLFIAEEVECHQHPGSLSTFAKAFCQQAKDHEIQLFLPTHSAECVRAFLAASVEAGAEAAVFHLKLDNGVLEATRLAPASAQTLLDTGVDLRFLDLYG
jgi:AAA15 family ATPase/GTPase